jgi:hypothetical protein
MSEKEAILGIDISKDKFSAALLKGEKKSQVKEFSNNLEGFEPTFRRLSKRNTSSRELVSVLVH